MMDLGRERLNEHGGIVPLIAGVVKVAGLDATFGWLYLIVCFS